MKFSSVFALCVMIDSCVVVYRVDAHFFWGRRRRRRIPPPPVIDCTYTSWSTWSTCTRYCGANGDQTRTRTVYRPASGGGSCNGPTSQIQSCTITNNCHGSSAQCNIYNGRCSCSNTGYYLDGNTCKDRNECIVNSGKGPCDQKCTNTAGSYQCSCDSGYLLSPPHSCQPKDCGVLSLPTCPSNSYVDSFSQACKKVSISCPSGTKFQQSCSLFCSNGYEVGKITSQSGQKFGQDYNKIDFNTAKTTTTCLLNQGGNGVAWDVLSEVNSYYCRRVNDPPTDISLSNAKLPEHSSVGHVVGNLTSKDMQQSQSYTYSVQKNSVLFTCQGNMLKSAWRDPDLRGSIPLQNGTIDITIRSKDDGNPAMWMDKVFTITITNVNDPPTNITLSNNNILENATVGHVIGIFKAKDKDDPPGKPASSNFIWTLTKDSNGFFAIKGGQLVVDKKLDHESQKVHVISISCTDRGSPPKTTTQDFVINVQNVNELPVSLALSSTSVDENSKPGIIVGMLTATDDDNDHISFSISQSSNLTFSKFKLSNSSCSSISRSVTCQSLLMVQGDLDFEVTASYHLIVVASDRSGQIVKEWTIDVVNKNEKPTAIKLMGSHEIPENSPQGTSVGSFDVTDPDNKNSITQRHHCELISGNVEYFTIEANTVVLKVSDAKTLDFETKKQLNITVKCTDDGSNPPNLFVTQWFVISVTDVNEPPLSMSLSKLTIQENSPKGTLVGKLSCNDPEKAYQNYTYTIEGPKDTPFKLGGSSHDDVIVDGHLDYEKTKQLPLTIRVTDSGGLYLEKMFTIVVEDVNERPKGIILQGQNNKLTIQEETIGFYISVINLDDEDAGDKDPSDCHLIDNAKNRVNLIKSSNLILKSGPKKTDYETSSGHLTITLNCSDSQDKSIVQSFNITITNINEKPTDITLTNNTVQENQDKVYIGVVTVTDPDIHQSHQCIVCEINKGGCSLGQLFEVTAAMELKTKKKLNFEAKNVYDIKITCTDQPPPQGSSLNVQRLFTVRVIDVNEPPSSLCPSPIFMSKLESNGAIIMPLNASDPDNEQSNKQKLSYSMDNDLYGGLFQLKENHIFKNKEISSLQSITLAITVTDNGRVVSIEGGFIFTRLLSTVFNCTVTVTDTQPSSSIHLSSNIVSILAPRDSLVGVLSTTGGTQGEVYTYKLLDSQFMPFVVVGNKIKVLLTEIPHVGISSPSSKELLEDIMIQSTDSKGRVITKKMIIVIKNDAPSIPMCLVKHSINENQPVNSIVGQILIEDPKQAKYQCSKTKCCSQIGQVPANSFKYHCQVNNPDDNAIILPKYNMTALFRVDDQYVLRSRVRFNYQDYADRKGQIKVAISCHDLIRPLHVLWMRAVVKIIDCDANYNCPRPSECAHCDNNGACQDDIGSYTCVCPAGYTGDHCQVNIDYCKPNLCQYGSSCVDMKTSFKCVCRPQYTGLLCDKNLELCKDCNSNSLCVKFVEAAKRCLSDEYQVPILVNEQNLNPQKLLTLEKEIAKLVEEKLAEEKKPVSNRKRRSSKARFHVETLKNESISDKTLLLLAIMDGNNGYEPLTATAACGLLKDTSRHCIDKTDCGAIKKSGKKCPVIGASKASAAARNEGGLGDGASAGIGLVVLFVFIVLLVGAVFYYRRQAKKSKACNDQNIVYNPNQESVNFQNPVYAEGNINNAVVLQDMMNDRLGKEDLVRANLDPNSVKKRNDIKVAENALYVPPPELSTENPSYIPAGAAACITKKNNIEDEKQVNFDPKSGKLFSYPFNTAVYEDLDDLRKEDPKTAEALSVPFDDHYEHFEDLKGNRPKESKVGKELAINGLALKGHTDEKTKNSIPREERRPRYEQNPVANFPKQKDHEYENSKVYNGAISNPLYDDSGLSSDPRKRIYENVVKTTEDVEKHFKIANPIEYENVGDNSIVNPLYDLADSTENLDHEPLYEDLPAINLPSSSEKPKKGFRRSMSSEKSSGYEELRVNQDGGKESSDNDILIDSNA